MDKTRRPIDRLVSRNREMTALIEVRTLRCLGSMAPRWLGNQPILETMAAIGSGPPEIQVHKHRLQLADILPVDDGKESRNHEIRDLRRM
nr:hypothetical protein CFP56_04060 [Quercus suber]